MKRTFFKVKHINKYTVTILSTEMHKTQFFKMTKASVNTQTTGISKKRSHTIYFLNISSIKTIIQREITNYHP